MIQDNMEKIYVDWLVNGKIKGVRRFATVADLPDLELKYDATPMPTDDTTSTEQRTVEGSSEANPRAKATEPRAFEPAVKAVQRWNQWTEERPFNRWYRELVELLKAALYQLHASSDKCNDALPERVQPKVSPVHERTQIAKFNRKLLVNQTEEMQKDIDQFYPF